MSGPDDAPGQAGGWGGFVAQPPADLEEVSVGLHVVAAAAGRHHVVPDVLAPAAARDDVVDAGCDATAVHAPAPVTGEQRPPGKRNGPPIGNPDESLEPDHAGCGDSDGRAVHIGAGFLQGDSLVLQDEDERAAKRYDAEWLVRRVEDQDVRHGCLLVRRRRVARAGTICSQSPLMPGGSATMSR